MDNCGKLGGKRVGAIHTVQNRPLIPSIKQTFPQKSAEKKYKLRKFAPKSQIVDKCTIPFIISNQQFTPAVHILAATGGKRNEQEKGG